MRHLFILFFSGMVFAQQTRFVDFKTAEAGISFGLNPRVHGEAAYTFNVINRIDTIRIDAVNMEFSHLTINGKAVNFRNSNKQLLLFEGFKKGNNTLSFDYTANPKQAIYFVGKNENTQIWTQGQGKYTSHWFPSFDDVNEKVIFSVNIYHPKNFNAISNGLAKAPGSYLKPEIANNMISSYKMEKPMSSYLLMLAVGKFDHRSEKSSSGIPLEYYYAPEDSAKFEPTYRYSKRIFDYLEKEIGVAYPWQIYRQIPVRDFLYGGMENTTSTLFNMTYVVDDIGYNDINYINVNAHELAHQWFGDMVTAKSGKHHWLQEGFATYFALLAEQELFGEDHFNYRLYEIAEQLQQAAKTDTIPILNEKASTLSFYQKGAWALHVLRENVGHEKFRKALKNYLGKYQFKNVETDEFLAEIKKVSRYDVDAFKRRWLEASDFPIQEALALLKKNRFINQYFAVAEMKDTPLSQKQKQFETLLASDAFYPIKEEIVYQLQDVPYNDKKALLLQAMRTNEWHVRRAVSSNFPDVPADFRSEYETLLDDPSYVTREIALNKLWSQFPEERVTFLDKSDGWIGLNDRNLRILWLAMALRTKDYRADKKSMYYEELLLYASADFETEVRQNAIENLIFLDKSDKNYLPFLVNGLVSHKWQFSKFARDKIRAQLKKQNHREYYEALLESLPANEKIQLDKLLKEK
ncbi:M1 family metallopeptidase [Flavobacterium sp.]|uniref:M1 family metallopeptidase n=1 Tax=Flavobacterium sp. TaxID=239 RepID=UPI00260F0F7F|nr:M1 family metallopeptidase [Flavobacterium sp.]